VRLGQRAAGGVVADQAASAPQFVVYPFWNQKLRLNAPLKLSL
jgi:hypothetical protein